MKRIPFDKQWLFYERDEANSFAFGPAPDSKMIDLPHDFIVGKPRSADAPGGAANGYFGDGEGVYKKTLVVPEEWAGKTVLMDIDGAYANLELMCNDELVAMHPHGYTPFQADITKALRFDGRKNLIKIITQSRQPSSRWYSGGGLYRDVCLWVGNSVCVKPWDVFVTTPKVEKDQATVTVTAEVTVGEPTAITGYITIYDAEGKRVARAKGYKEAEDNYALKANLTVKNPILWDLDNPYLYTYEVSLYDGDNELDVASDTFGIRTIEVDAVNGFRLNGKHLNLKGGCIHHDNGLLGACAYPKAEERKIRLMKSVGYNLVRISHYPPSTAMLKVCDRLGMLLMDEAFDVWRVSKVAMDYHLYFEDWWERDITYMVMRDRNHPCVITYSIGNEITERDGKNNGAEWSRKLAAKVRELDDTRFVTSAICGVTPETDDDYIVGGGSNFDVNLMMDNDSWNRRTAAYAEPLDIVGYNYLKDIYQKSHEMFPKRVILGTETHSWTTYEYWKQVEDHPYVIGDCIWTALDYLGEVGVGKVYWENKHEEFNFMTEYPWRTSWQADIDLTGEQRPQSVYREIMWGHTDKSGIFTTHPVHYGENFNGSQWHWYDCNDCWYFDDQWIGKPVKTDIYGDGDEAEFILNGTSLGRARIEKLIATMDIPYTPGVLEGVVYKNGVEVSRCEIRTPGEAAQLELTPEYENYKADNLDLMYVRIILRDAEGNRLTADQREITVSLEGDAEFLTLGSANPCTEDHITAKNCHLYRGSAIMVVKSAKAGDTKITVRTEDGIEGTVTVTAVE